MLQHSPIRITDGSEQVDLSVLQVPTSIIRGNGLLNLTGVVNQVILPADVVNNNGSANTIADVTGLSFAVEAGNLYQFEFTILYSAAATTTGSRWAINGPANPTYLVYSSEYSLTSTTSTRNANVIAYDSPSGASATSGATGSNLAYIYGLIQPATAGTVIARFASEVSSSAITARAGSVLRWAKLT